MKYIKLFEEHGYSVYELITMSPYKVIDLFMSEIKKEYPDLELIRDILEYSVVDVNGKDKDGTTALMWAVFWGHKKPVELLLNHPGIDVNVQNESGMTALMLASDLGHEKFIELLLKHPGIDVNLQDENGQTALMRAADMGRGECVELLLNHPGIDVNLQTKIGRTAWDLASMNIRQKFPQLNPNFQ